MERNRNDVREAERYDGTAGDVPGLTCVNGALLSRDG
jgi:hypothetical protein